MEPQPAFPPSGGRAARRRMRPAFRLLGLSLVVLTAALGLLVVRPDLGAAESAEDAPAVAMAATLPTSTTSTAPVKATRSVSSVNRGTSSQLRQVMAIADETGWDWRGAGLTINIAFHPDGCCHWGVYDGSDSSLWIGPTAFASRTRLRYVVLHEIAHAWQWQTGRFARLRADLSSWGWSGDEALEAGADCVATLWGARTNHYWSCPSGAQALLARRLAGDWS